MLGESVVQGDITATRIAPSRGHGHGRVGRDSNHIEGSLAVTDARTWPLIEHTEVGGDLARPGAGGSLTVEPTAVVPGVRRTATTPAPRVQRYGSTRKAPHRRFRR